jgi:gamma-glutamyltranspeptidase
VSIPKGRPAATASSSMVTSPHHVASAAGVDVLRSGGSAVDAAIATSAVLSVVYPHMTGIGGDAFWLVHEGETGAVRYLSGGGRAAARATPAWFSARGHKQIPLRGVVPATTTVPGAVASWTEAHARYGRVPLARALAAAIDYASDGFTVTGRLATFLQKTQGELAACPESAALFLIDGRAPTEGERLKNPDLANTLRLIAAHGWSGFYEGPVAIEMARFAAQHDGLFDMDDLSRQRATWGDPIVGSYRGIEVYNTPAPTQGFTVLEMLNLIEPHMLGDMTFLGPDHIHLLVQAKQIAYHDRDAMLADPAFVDVPIARLISKSYADQRRPLMDPAKALPWDKVPSFGSLAGDTVYIAVVDSDNNAVSLIQSLYGLFGSTTVAGSTGVLLQNRGAYFSLEENHPNCVRPGKIPLHTLIASMAKRDGKLWSVLGCMGADGQPQIQLQVYTAMVDFGLDVQEALDAPRFLSGRFGLGEARDNLHLENRVPVETIDELTRRGHLTSLWGPWSEQAGHAHGILIEAHTRILHGGADPRSDGAAIGY